MRIILASAIVAAVAGAQGTACAQSIYPRGRVIFPDGTKVTVEVVDTEATRERGLMFRKGLAPDAGMIFVFDAVAFYPFWMKNTLIPLDMLWLDAGARVVSIARSVPPCKADPCPSYSPDADALYVVELAAGFARQHNVKVGDVLKLENVPKTGR